MRQEADVFDEQAVCDQDYRHQRMSWITCPSRVSRWSPARPFGEAAFACLRQPTSANKLIDHELGPGFQGSIALVADFVLVVRAAGIGKYAGYRPRHLGR